MVVDTRTNPNTGHAWFFTIDEKNHVIHIMSTQTCRILHTWSAFRDPRGLSVSGTRLYVTDFAGNTLSALDIGSVGPPGTLGVPDRLKDLANANVRLDLPVGRGPKGVCIGPSNSLVITANSGDDSATIVNANTYQVLTTIFVGSDPIEAEMSYPTGSGTFAWVSCRGGANNPDGSVSLYWTGASGLQADVTNFVNPTGMAYDLNAAVWVANTGSDTVSQLTLQLVGSGFAQTILPSITATVQVGANPIDVAMESYFSYTYGAPQAVVTADQGASQLTFFDPNQPSRPAFSLPIAGVRSIAGFMSR
jgi:YVTN family beta-propeller protein